MARTRTLKPGFFKNEYLAELGPGGMCLFAGLWTLADKEGRLEDRPKRIKAEVFPYFDFDVDGYLDALQERGFIVRYETDGARYIQIVNWQHQRPHNNETASTIPPCPDCQPRGAALCTIEESGVVQGDNDFGLDTVYLNTENLNTGNLTLDSRAPAREAEPEQPYAMLETFCAATDRDIGKLTTREKNASLAVAKRLIADDVACAEVRGFVAYLATQDWRTEPVTMFTVEKGIGTWRASGSPAVSKARASPAVNGTTFDSDLRRMHEDLVTEERNGRAGNDRTVGAGQGALSHGKAVGTRRETHGPVVADDPG